MGGFLVFPLQTTPKEDLHRASRRLHIAAQLRRINVPGSVRSLRSVPDELGRRKSGFGVFPNPEMGARFNSGIGFWRLKVFGCEKALLQFEQPISWVLEVSPCGRGLEGAGLRRTCRTTVVWLLLGGCPRGFMGHVRATILCRVTPVGQVVAVGA